MEKEQRIQIDNVNSTTDAQTNVEDAAVASVKPLWWLEHDDDKSSTSAATAEG